MSQIWDITGVEELRVRDRSGTYRVFYLARLADEVLVFHAFTKKTQKTPLVQISLAEDRLRDWRSRARRP